MEEDTSKCVPECKEESALTRLEREVNELRKIVNEAVKHGILTLNTLKHGLTTDTNKCEESEVRPQEENRIEELIQQVKDITLDIQDIRQTFNGINIIVE